MSRSIQSVIIFSVRALVLALLVLPLPAAAGDIGFVDIAGDPATGIDYTREASAREAKFAALKRQPTYTMSDIIDTPLKGRGAPGVALFDHDGDGDLDIYVTNGPGVPNSLFENRLVPDGRLTFVDVAMAVGAGLVDQDSDGVCFGDTDNDGDPDLLVLGAGEPNRFLENLGGVFVEATAKSAGGVTSQIGDSARWSTSCSMGDVDGDGLLDLFVGNTYTDWSQQAAIFVEPFAQNEHNQLFSNRGDNVFVDVSGASGVEVIGGVPAGEASITWAVAMVDLDRDGDLDLLQADDQAAFPPAMMGGIDRGYLQVFLNDGSGQFTNTTMTAGTASQGQWMGLTFGDFDCDGTLDFFGSNVGDYMMTLLPMNYQLGGSTSRWFLGNGDGTFRDPGVGDLVATPFGWGTSSFDYDNDGDLDLVFHGGLEVGPLVDASNPGVLLENEGACTARFGWDRDAFAASVDHARRNVQGVAVGDLDLDGFPDIVTAASFDSPEPIPLADVPTDWGSPFDEVARFVPTFAPTGAPMEFTWTGIEFTGGSLTVEINSGDNGNRSVTVETVGAVGLLDGARAPRDGIGAQVTVTPHKGTPVIRPVVGGASYASQDALVQTYGLGDANWANVEVLWPGGTRTLMFGVRAGERVRVPEIPCSTDAGRSEYRACVRVALDELLAQGVIDKKERAHLLVGANSAHGEAAAKSGFETGPTPPYWQ